MARSKKKIMDEFFYNNYQRCWPRATSEQMQFIYFNEMECLLRAFEDKHPYYQEFARDYTLKNILALAHSGAGTAQGAPVRPTDARHQTEDYCPPTVDFQPYSILPAVNGVVFKYYDKVELVLPFAQFFRALEKYMETLEELYPEIYRQQLLQDEMRKVQIRTLLEEASSPLRTEYACKQSRRRAEMLQRLGRWHERLDELKRRNWKESLQKLVPRSLRFWEPKEVPGDPLVRFTGSKKVVLHPGSLLSFKQLDCADTLTSLNAVALTAYLDLEVLSLYTRLKTLRLCHMQISDISFVAHMPELEELILLHNNVSDLSPVKGLNKLNHLYLAANPIRDFSVLATLPALQRLYVDPEQMPDEFCLNRVPEQVTVTVVKVVLLAPDPKQPFEPNTTVQVIASRPGRQQVKQSESIQPKVPLDNGTGSGGSSLKVQPKRDPRKLAISDRFLYSGLFNALGFTPSVYHDLLKVKTLDCSNRIALQPDHMFLMMPGDFSCLKHAVNLRQLNLSGRQLKGFDWISSCTKLQKLDLSGTNFSDLKLLDPLKDLRELNLKGCKELVLDDSAVVALADITVLHLDEDQEQELNLFGRALECFTSQSSRSGCQLDWRLSLKPELDSAGRFDRSQLWLQARESLPDDFLLFSLALAYPGTISYMQLVYELARWQGTLQLRSAAAAPTADAPAAADSGGQTERFKLWLLTKETLKDTRLNYPWSQECARLQPEVDIYLQHQQTCSEMEQTIKKILEDSNDPELCDQFDALSDDLYEGYEVDTDNLSARLRYLIGLQKTVNELNEEKPPQLPKLWRPYLPFIAVQRELIPAARTAVPPAAEVSPAASDNATEAGAADKSWNKSDPLAQQFKDWRFYLIEKSKGSVLELSYSPERTLRQVAPNLIWFMLHWSEILLHRSFAEVEQTLEAPVSTQNAAISMSPDSDGQMEF